MSWSWISWAIFVLGIWIVLTGIIGATRNWIDIGCGIVIAILAIIGALQSFSE